MMEVTTLQSILADKQSIKSCLEHRLSKTPPLFTQGELVGDLVFVEAQIALLRDLIELEQKEGVK